MPVGASRLVRHPSHWFIRFWNKIVFDLFESGDSFVLVSSCSKRLGNSSSFFLKSFGTFAMAFIAARRAVRRGALDDPCHRSRSVFSKVLPRLFHSPPVFCLAALKFPGLFCPIRGHCPVILPELLSPRPVPGVPIPVAPLLPRLWHSVAIAPAPWPLLPGRVVAIRFERRVPHLWRADLIPAGL